MVAIQKSWTWENLLLYQLQQDKAFQWNPCLPKNKETSTSQTSSCLVPAYTHKLTISSKKSGDLLKLCEDYVIPERYHRYHENLIGGGADEDKEPTFDEDKGDDMEPEEQWLAYIFSISFNTDRNM